MLRVKCFLTSGGKKKATTEVKWLFSTFSKVKCYAAWTLQGSLLVPKLDTVLTTSLHLFYHAEGLRSSRWTKSKIHTQVNTFQWRTDSLLSSSQHYIQHEYISETYSTQHDLRINQWGGNEWRPKGEAAMAHPIHHHSWQICSFLLWVKKVFWIEKCIISWFAISIKLLGKSHQNIPQLTDKLITSETKHETNGFEGRLCLIFITGTTKAFLPWIKASHNTLTLATERLQR